MHKLPHLFKSRHGVFYLRLARGGQEVKRSLRTKDFRQARLLALAFNPLAFNLELAMKTPDDKPKAADFDLDADSLKRLDVIFPDGTQVKDINTDDDVRRAKELFGDRFAAAVPAPPSFDLPAFSPPVAAAIAAQKAAQETKRKAKPFADVAKLYKKEKALDNAARTIVAKERAFADFEKRIGSRPIEVYLIDDAVAYKNTLIDEGGSASRINAKLSFLRDLFAYALANGLRAEANPFENVQVSSKSKLEQQKRSYKPFSEADIATIFDPAAYTARMDKPGYRWLPFLALYSGARLEELASLRLDQLQREGDVWFFDIQKAKNANSQRRIPLHRVVAESGFLAYAEGLRERGATRRFADYLDERKITDDRKVFHSFRHTFIVRMTELNVHPAMLMALVGHYDQAKVDFSSPHFANYQHAKPLAELKSTLDRFEVKLAFPF